MRREQIYHYFFFVTFILLLCQLWLLIAPFVASILGAVVLTVLLRPLYDRFRHAFPRQSSTVHAACFTLMVTLSIIGPIILVGWLVFNESQAIAPAISSWKETLVQLRSGSMSSSPPWLAGIQKSLYRVLGVGPTELRAFVLRMAEELFGLVNQSGKKVIHDAALFLIQLAVMIFTLFFFQRDGKAIWEKVLRLVPMRKKHKQEISKRLETALVEIVRGGLLTSLVQMGCATVGYLIAGVPAAVTLGLMTGVAAFLPVIGSSLIWVPIGISLLFKGSVGKGLFVLLWGGLLVSVLDNVLRPILVRSKAKLPILLLFFGMMGGLAIYGLKGVLLGPLVIVLILVYVNIYKEQYLRSEHFSPVDDSDVTSFSPTSRIP